MHYEIWFQDGEHGGSYYPILTHFGLEGVDRFLTDLLGEDPTHPDDSDYYTVGQVGKFEVKLVRVYE